MIPVLSRIDTFIEKALDGLALRQRVTSDNVANVDTPGYRASRVEFEDVLHSALERGRGADGSEPEQRPRVVTPRLHGQSDGNNVDIDTEMVLLAETNLTYNALAQVTSGRLRV